MKYQEWFGKCPLWMLALTMLVLIGIPTGIWSLFRFTITIGGPVQGAIIGFAIWSAVWWIARRMPIM